MNEGGVPLRLGLVLLSTLAIQVGLASRLRIEGVAADLPLVLTLAAALTAGPERGAVTGFLAGLSLDLVLPTPAGLGALTYCITGYVVGSLLESQLRTSAWLPVLGWLGGSLLGVALFAVGGAVIGEIVVEWPDAAVVTGIVAGFSAILGPFAMRVTRWVFEDRDALRPVLR